MARNDNQFRTNVNLNVEAMAVEVAIIEKESGEAVASQTYAARDVHDSVKSQVALYGLSKLLQDRASDVAIGPGKLEAMAEVHAQLTAGQWQKERKVGATVVSAEVEALAQLKSISVPAAQQALKAYPKDARDKILANPKIVALAEEIRKARADAEAISLDDLAGAEEPQAATA